MGLFGDITRGLGDVATFGTNELAGNPIGQAGDSLASGGINGLVDSLTGATSARDANATNIALQNSANAFNAAQAQKQMDFQERMSNSSYQRAVADMQAAGINPLMAVSNGGASTPVGAAATGVAAHVQPVPTALSGLVSTASQILPVVGSLSQSLSASSANRAAAVNSLAQAERAGADADLLRKKGPEADVSEGAWSFVRDIMNGLRNHSAAQNAQDTAVWSHHMFGTPLQAPLNTTP